MKAHGGKRANAGRPPTGRVSVTLRLTPTAITLITRLAFLENLSLGEVIEARFTKNTVFTIGEV